MKNLTCKNLNNNTLLFDDLEKPKNFFKRNNGLMLRSKLKNNQALMITGCNCIHTFFMKFNIDVIYLNRKMEIKKIKLNIKPNRFTLPVLGAWHVIEFSSGNKIINDIKEGDVICVSS